MKSVFVDTHFWVAMVNPQDQWHSASEKAKKVLGDAMLVTTDEVLIELMNAFGNRGDQVRRAAVDAVEAILNNPNVRVLPQTRDGFLAGIKRYKERMDKGYSLTDCISMNVMESQGLREVLTNDHHFEQEGYVALVR